MLELNVQLRNLRGKRVKKLRKDGIIPGVVYGPGIDSFSVMVPYGTFENIYKQAGPGTLVNLEIEGREEKNGSTPEGKIPVLIHEPARDVLSDNFIHVDFYKVRLDKLIRISIPLVFEGSSPAVEEEGGVLIKNIYDVEIEGFPLKLPKEVTVDISKLKTFDDKILIKDIQSPEGTTVLGDPDQFIASVSPPRTVEEIEALEEIPEEEVEKVEVEGEEDGGEKSEEEARAEKEEKQEQSS